MALFLQSSASVLENVVGQEVLRLKVSDKDQSGSPNANTKYSLIRGNEGGEFRVSTAANEMDAILTTAKVANTANTHFCRTSVGHARFSTLLLRRWTSKAVPPLPCWW